MSRVADPDPEVRSAIARIGAHAMHSQYGGIEVTQAARDKAFQRFIEQVDPDRKLSEAERIRRAKHAQKAHMLMMALKSKQARAARKAQRERGEAV